MVSLGNETRSTASTRSPCRASSIAVAAPATRAPTTITSYRPAPMPASLLSASIRYRMGLPYGTVQSWRSRRQAASGGSPATTGSPPPWARSRTAAWRRWASNRSPPAWAPPRAASTGTSRTGTRCSRPRSGAGRRRRPPTWSRRSPPPATRPPASWRLVAGVIERAEQDRVGPALLASAAHPAVAPALERVTAARLNLIATVFRRLGFPRAEARRRALLADSAYLGHGQLAHSTPGVLPATRGGRRAYLDDAIHALTTR